MATPERPSPTFPTWLGMMPTDEVIRLVKGGSTLAMEYVAYCDQVFRDARKAAENEHSEKVNG